jgi:zinc protease
MGVMTDQAADGHSAVSLTIRARQLVLFFSLVTVLLASSGDGAAPVVDTMVLHIPSQTITLPNGLTVVVSPRDKLPVAALSLRFKVGSAYDPEDKAGLADMTARHEPWDP